MVAIASRDGARASAAASALGIARAHASYEALLADPDVDAVYIPLPNHLHVPWTTRAAEAGKHVLCEKPIGLSAAEARTLLEVRDRTGVRIQEAFMIRTHPQWLRAKELVDAGDLGEVRAMSGFFSYFNTDAANVQERGRVGRRRPARHRLLPGQHRPVHLRRRAGAGCGTRWIRIRASVSIASRR